MDTGTRHPAIADCTPTRVPPVWAGTARGFKPMCGIATLLGGAIEAGAARPSTPVGVLSGERANTPELCGAAAAGRRACGAAATVPPAAPPPPNGPPTLPVAMLEDEGPALKSLKSGNCLTPSSKAWRFAGVMAPRGAAAATGVPRRASMVASNPEPASAGCAGVTLTLRAALLEGSAGAGATAPTPPTLLGQRPRHPGTSPWPGHRRRTPWQRR